MLDRPIPVGRVMRASHRARVASMALALLMAPLAAETQPGKVPRIGLLETGSLAARASLWEAFRQAMRELGYVEGRTVLFEARGGDGRSERLPALAAELVRLKVDVIVTAGSTAAQAARQATATIPIVMTSGNPVELGLVTSLARPGGNITGVTTLSIELAAKRLEMAREVVPAASGFAILGDAGNPNSLSNIREAEAAARTLGVRLHAVTVRGPEELRRCLLGDRAGARGSPHGDPQPDVLRGARAPGRARREASAPDRVRLSGVRPGRRPDRVRSRPGGRVPARTRLRRQDPEGRAARRPAHRAGGEGPGAGEPQDREGARVDDPAVRAGAGGRDRPIDDWDP